MLPWHDISI
jgi:hypothetical protein